MTPDEACDREAIRDLMARYNINGDRARIEAFAATFAPEGTLEFSGEATRGRAAIFARLSGGSAPRDPRHTFSRHHLTTSLVELDGDRATARTYFHVLTDIGLDHHGHYADRLCRIDGEWFFEHRSVRIDWQSPLSLNARFHVGGKPPSAA
jgi:hypothetical protein